MQQRYRNIPNSFIYFDISPFISVQNSIQFTLSNTQKFPFDVSYLADQIDIYPKAKIKIPSFTNSYTLFTPQSFEQASSEEIALFKTNLISGSSILDICGGLGVDDWAFAKTFEKVVSIDVDNQLNKIVRENFKKLKVSNIIRIDDDAYSFVDNNVDSYDWIYVDADRRNDGKRTFALAETQPNILLLKDKLFEFSPNILLKVSPMLDLHVFINELKTVSHIWVIAVKNEVKEILIRLDKTESENIKLTAVNLNKGDIIEYSNIYNTKLPKDYKSDGQYFYEPSLALIKAGIAEHYLTENGISQIAQNSAFGISYNWVDNFFGRAFNIKEQFVFTKSTFTHYIRVHKLHQANISKRNFPIDVAAIRKQYKITEGGDDFLFFTTNAQGQKLCFHCSK